MNRINTVTIFFLFVAFCLQSIYCQQYWIRQNSPTSKFLTKSFFVDSTYGWAIGDSGTIVHTSNGGDNWVMQQSGIDAFPLEDVFFVDRNNGWVTCNDFAYQGSIILKTTNGGQNWQFGRFPDTSMILHVIHFLNPSTGFISGFSGYIFKTTNGGSNWFQTSFDTAGCFYLIKKEDFVFADSQNGYSCGGIFDFQGIILKTTDGGMNWFSYCLSPEPMFEIQVSGQNTVAAMGGDFEFGGMSVQSFNSGTNWIYENIGCFGNATGFDFRTPSEVWAALSFSGYFGLNVDSMKPNSPWQCILCPENEGMYDVKFATPTRGWCVGSNGSIFKYNTAVIGLNGNTNTIIKEFVLHQNYPNPYNPETNISYEVPAASEINIIIYDVLGKTLKVFREGLRVPGFYNLKFNAGELSSGIYYYQLQSGKYIVSRKMVILK